MNYLNWDKPKTKVSHLRFDGKNEIYTRLYYWVGRDYLILDSFKIAVKIKTSAAKIS